jgi:hypothetical protein
LAGAWLCKTALSQMGKLRMNQKSDINHPLKLFLSPAIILLWTFAGIDSCWVLGR